VIRAAIAAGAAATRIAAAPGWADREDTIVVIGDTPYGDAQVANCPNDVAEITPTPTCAA
jgi:hypothetical protein